MPWSLKRFQQTGHLHFLTISCYRRQRFFDSPGARRIFEVQLERVRRWYGFIVAGYVVMPEHVHLLVSEPERKPLSVAIQMLKQLTSAKIGRNSSDKRFWQRRYFDFNVHASAKRIEKLRYMHRNPVARGLCTRPEDWEWSSFRHYATGFDGVIEIESEWTARRRERMGLCPTVNINRPTLSLREKGRAPENL